jgi:hypothetical protein
LSSHPSPDVDHETADVDHETRCPDCGARNPRGAEWCGQCLRRFPSERPSEGEAQRAPPPKGSGQPVPGSASASETPAAPDGRTGPFRVAGEVVTWTCALCDADNALDRSDCAVCGAQLAATLRPPRELPARDAGTAALLSLLLPGAGHAYVGQWGQALGRAVTSVWVACMALIFALGHGVASPLSLAFQAAALGLWAASAHDAYREAAGQSGAVILAGRSLLWTWVALVLLSILGIFVSMMPALR